MFHFDKDIGALVTFIDPEFADEPCVVEKGCEFFEDIVVKGITGV